MNEVSVGSVLGGYRLQALVGQGGMGIVYMAQSVDSGAICAVKILPPDMARQPGFRERFERESRYANSIAHPNIIEVYGAGEENGILYLAMQYVEGRDLKAVLAAEGPLDAPRAVGLLSQIASALDAAHTTGLLHRDIKPGNIMISPPQTPGAPWAS